MMTLIINEVFEVGEFFGSHVMVENCNSLQVEHSWFFNVHVAHSGLKVILGCLFFFFKASLNAPWNSGFYLLVKPIHLFQLLIGEGFVDLFAHGVRCLVELLLESHPDQQIKSLTLLLLLELTTSGLKRVRPQTRFLFGLKSLKASR